MRFSFRRTGGPLTGIVALVLGSSLSSCGLYKNIMLQTDEELDEYTLEWKREAAEQNYVLAPGDQFTISVTTNGGEILIDPDFELQRQLITTQLALQQQPPTLYQLYVEGQAILPKLDTVTLAGYTLREADSLLSARYAEFYVSPYVRITLANRRVIVLGGGTTTQTQNGKVIPLSHERMNLLEVLAEYGGIDRRAKATNIRIIRGDLKEPQVQVVDLSTVKGMTQADLVMQPGDIVYIEPQKRVISESFTEFGPILNLFTSVVTLVVLIATLNR